MTMKKEKRVSMVMTWHETANWTYSFCHQIIFSLSCTLFFKPLSSSHDKLVNWITFLIKTTQGIARLETEKLFRFDDNLKGKIQKDFPHFSFSHLSLTMEIFTRGKVFLSHNFAFF
jgi:hypothetical protein